MSQALLRLPQVIERTGLARASIYLAIKRGEFPKAIQLGLRAVAWPSEDIDAWIAGRIESGRKASPHNGYAASQGTRDTLNLVDSP